MSGEERLEQLVGRKVKSVRNHLKNTEISCRVFLIIFTITILSNFHLLLLPFLLDLRSCLWGWQPTCRDWAEARWERRVWEGGGARSTGHGGSTEVRQNCQKRS